jgi:hypothetical protein
MQRRSLLCHCSTIVPIFRPLLISKVYGKKKKPSCSLQKKYPPFLRRIACREKGNATKKISLRSFVLNLLGVLIIKIVNKYSINTKIILTLKLCFTYRYKSRIHFKKFIMDTTTDLVAMVKGCVETKQISRQQSSFFPYHNSE